MTYAWPVPVKATTRACPVCSDDSEHDFLGIVQTPQGDQLAWFQCGDGEFTFCDTVLPVRILGEQA